MSNVSRETSDADRFLDGLRTLIVLDAQIRHSLPVLEAFSKVSPGGQEQQ